MRLETLELGVPFPGVTLGYTDWGAADAARTVVCVHGLTRNARDFDALAAAIAARGARAIAVDVVGRGRSTWLADPAGYTVPTYLAHLARFLGLLGLDAVDWVGTSMGGIIGMVLAAQDRPPIRRLVLNDVGPFVPRRALLQIQAYLGLDLSFATLEDVEAHLRTIHAPFGPLADAQWRHLALNSAREAAGRWRLGYDPQIRVPYGAAASADIDLWPLWDRIRTPTFVLRGGDSTLLLPETAAEMARRGPRATVATVPGVGHAPALMDAGQIATILRWLDLDPAA